jgi:hypothetical protein
MDETLPMPPTIRLLAPLAALLCLASAAGAQSYLQNNSTLVVPGTMPDPGVANRRINTRLEPGAVLCHSAEELQERQASLVRQQAGGQGAGERAWLPAGCVMLTARVPVEVLERLGPGRTRVKVLGRSQEIGWTDAWLPDRRG